MSTFNRRGRLLNISRLIITFFYLSWIVRFSLGLPLYVCSLTPGNGLVTGPGLAPASHPVTAWIDWGLTGNGWIDVGQLHHEEKNTIIQVQSFLKTCRTKGGRGQL